MIKVKSCTYNDDGHASWVRNETPQTQIRKHSREFPPAIVSQCIQFNLRKPGLIPTEKMMNFSFLIMVLLSKFAFAKK